MMRTRKLSYDIKKGAILENNIASSLGIAICLIFLTGAFFIFLTWKIRERLFMAFHVTDRLKHPS